MAQRKNKYINDEQLIANKRQQLVSEGQALEQQRIQISDQVENNQRGLDQIDARLDEIDAEIDALPKPPADAPTD